MQVTQISDNDWLYVCTIAMDTQDVVQRRLLLIIAGMAGRKLPSFPNAAVSEQKGPA